MKDLENCNIYIITVPTPINRYKEPDVSYLKSATELVAKYIKNISLYMNLLFILEQLKSFVYLYYQKFQN